MNNGSVLKSRRTSRVMNIVRILLVTSRAEPLLFWGLVTSRLFSAAIPVVNIIFTSLIANAIVLSLSVHHPQGITEILTLFLAFKLVSVVLSASESISGSLFLQKAANFVHVRVMRGVAKIPLERLESADMQNELFFLRTESAQSAAQITANLSKLLSEALSIAAIVYIALLWGGVAESLVFLAVLPLAYSDVKTKRWGFALATRLARFQRENYYYSFLMTGISTIRELAALRAVETVVARYYRNFSKIYAQTRRYRLSSSALQSGAFLLGTIMILGIQFLIIQSGVVHGESVGQILALFQSVAVLLLSLETLLRTSGEVYHDGLFVNRFAETPEVWDEVVRNTADSADDASVETGCTVKTDGSCVLDLSGVGYRRGQTVVFGGVNLGVRGGERIGIVGPNGSGKTTLCELIAGIRTPSEGYIHVNGVPVCSLSGDERSRIFSVQFQDFAKFELRYVDNIDMTKDVTPDAIEGIAQHITGLDPNSPIRYEEELLTSNIGTWFENSRQLSGGEWQRLALYRTLYRQAPFYILDEPTSQLDRSATLDVANMLAKISQEAALIVVSHDHDFLRQLSCRMYELKPHGLVSLS